MVIGPTVVSMDCETPGPEANFTFPGVQSRLTPACCEWPVEFENAQLAPSVPAPNPIQK
jgi:hypothetical protein